MYKLFLSFLCGLHKDLCCFLTSGKQFMKLDISRIIPDFRIVDIFPKCNSNVAKKVVQNRIEIIPLLLYIIILTFAQRKINQIN